MYYIVLLYPCIQGYQGYRTKYDKFRKNANFLDRYDSGEFYDKKHKKYDNKVPKLIPKDLPFFPINKFNTDAERFFNPPSFDPPTFDNLINNTRLTPSPLPPFIANLISFEEWESGM